MRTLKKLLSLSDPPSAFRTTCNRHFCVISDCALQLCAGKVIRHTEAYTAFICERGTCDVRINEVPFHLTPQKLLFCQPGTRIESTHISDDYFCKGFYLSKRFFTELLNVPMGMWNVNRFLSSNPVVSLSETAQALFLQYYQMIERRISASGNDLRNNFVMRNLMQAFICEFHAAMEVSHIAEQPAFTSADNLYRSFLDLIFSTYPKPREVTWYADRLHVSPKYLSFICKSNCGETASQLIRRLVIEDVERMLGRPDKSIKEVAGELNFSTLSFFGKYVKKNFGLSPKLFRRGLIEAARVTN